MATKAATCAGCLAVIRGRRYMKCSICVQAYDLACASVSEKQFTNNLVSLHDWKCDLCKSKEPKGDNTNTPIRGANKTVNQPEGASSTKDLELISCGTKTQCKLKLSPVLRSDDEDMIVAIKDRLMAAIKLELPALLAVVIKAELEPISKDLEELRELQQTVALLNHNQEEMKKSVDALGDVNNKLRADNRSLRSANTELSDRLNNMLDRLKKSESGTSSSETHAQAGPPIQERKQYSEAVLKNNKVRLSHNPTSPRQPAQLVNSVLCTVSSPERPSLGSSTVPPTQPDRENWTTVQHRKPRKSMSLRCVAGPAVTFLKAAESRKHFHLWNMLSEENDVKRYLSQLLQHRVFTVEQLNTSNHYNSFKIGVPEDCYELCFSVDVWPDNARVKPWINYKKRKPAEDRTFRHGVGAL